MSAPRRRPELRLRVPFEGDLHLSFAVETPDDEQRLFDWLVASGVLYELADFVCELHHALDERVS